MPSCPQCNVFRLTVDRGVDFARCEHAFNTTDLHPVVLRADEKLCGKGAVWFGQVADNKLRIA